MPTRIHIVLDEADKARYRRQAEREGKSLGAWLRAAAEDRLRAAGARRKMQTRAELEEFFEACDAREGHAEPDWEDHERIIHRSRTGDLDVS